MHDLIFPLAQIVSREQTPLLGLAGIIVLGISAQWLAWRIKLPAILLLLTAGVTVGPVWQTIYGHKLIDPDDLFGPLFQPIISLSVALVLFEGGLTLNLSDLRQSGQVLWRLVTFGALATWIIISVAAALVLGLAWNLAILLGAILVVTGPTVIGPLLRFVRPVGEVGSILKWEGIVIDPIGATLALLVFEVISGNTPGSFAHVIAISVAKTLVLGALCGFAGATVIVILLRRFWVSDRLHAPMTLMFVVLAFVGANAIQDESGLLAVTVMGILLANQRYAPVAHILEFKESLSVLLIGSLFILLGARLEAVQVTRVGWQTAIFVAVLVLIARPISVWLCTVGTKLPWRQRIFLAWMAPRGIVAAAVASVFALKLRAEHFPGAEQLVPVTFAVIVATVSIYGLTSSLVARRLKLSNPANRGFLIAGANSIARQIGAALKEAGQVVLLVDTNRENIAAARMEGLETFQGNILSEQLLHKVEGTGIGRLLAITPNTDLNSLAAMHFSRHFGRSNVFQLSVSQAQHVTARVKADMTHELQGRTMFDPKLDFQSLSDRFAAGQVIKRTLLTREFGFENLAAQNAEVSTLFVIDPTSELHVSTVSNPIVPKAGQTVMALVSPMPKPEAGNAIVSSSVS